MISMIKKIPFYALVIKGGDAATMAAVAPTTNPDKPDAAAVVHHDAFVAQLVRYRGEHVQPGKIGHVIADYNNLVSKPGSLNTINDPYMLTLYLIVCDVSLRNEGDVHKPLNTPCEKVDGERGIRAHQKLARSLRRAEQAPVSAAAAASEVSELPPPTVPRLDVSAALLEHSAGEGSSGSAAAAAAVRFSGGGMPMEAAAALAGSLPGRVSPGSREQHFRRREIMTGWGKHLQGEAVLTSPDYVTDAIKVLSAIVPKIQTPFSEDAKGEWDVCRQLKRGIRTTTTRLQGDLMSHVCFDIPTKFAGSADRGHELLEDYLFRVSTGRIATSSSQDLSGQELRNLIMTLWNDALREFKRIDSGEQSVQTAIWLLYLNDGFSSKSESFNIGSPAESIKLCTLLRETLRSPSGQMFGQEKNIQPGHFIHHVCGDLGGFHQ
jgi:hypothetical protein